MAAARKANHAHGTARLALGVVFGELVASAVLYVVYLDHSIRTLFEGQRWALPARVYARPLELYPGTRLSLRELLTELKLLHYRNAPEAHLPGTSTAGADGVRLVTRSFTFWDGRETTLPVSVRFTGEEVTGLTRADTGAPLDLVRLDPMLIGSIYPAQREDRVLVRLADVPPLVLKTLIAVEDRRFYKHHGVSPRAILRAFFANVRALGTVQGGSTITQQLVKNFFLSNERTLTRKINELIMSLLLEWHYSKNEILEAYLNEVYLGQEGSRAIHGFGLASQFYFERPLDQLAPQHAALLIALIKGPSVYDPRRHPKAALLRRNLVLDVMAQQGVFSTAAATRAKAAALDVTPKAPSGNSPYPAFMDLARRLLKREYREEDLNSEGLQVFTTLDPVVQQNAERALTDGLAQIEQARGKPRGQLQGAVVVTSVEGAEVLAVVGGREARYSGFNRALDAERQIGSLVKPAVYLTALARPASYTLATLLDDEPLYIRNPGGGPWAPQNYDHRYHGEVALITALAESYNVATARLGLALGVPEVVKTLQGLGIERDIRPYPSLLLGALDLTPVDVAEMYQTYAGEGFRMPLRAIREVMAADGKPLQRYALTVEQPFAPGPVHLLNRALQEVVHSGTAAGVLRTLGSEIRAAGKTGTTDNLRDSWFAGFTGDKLAVVWVGRDDNKPTGLSGASGALRVWGDLMGALSQRPFPATRPANIEMVRIDPGNGLRAGPQCAGALELPFIIGSLPPGDGPCGNTESDESGSRWKTWFKGLMP